MIKNLMTNMKMKKKKGFTLVELIVVIAIIAIIAAFAIPNFMTVQNNAKIDADVNLGRNIANAVEVLTTDDTIAKSIGSFTIKTSATNADSATDNGLHAAYKVESNLKANSLKLKSTGAADDLTVTVDSNGQVTKIVSAATATDVLYTSGTNTPTGRFKK